MIETLQQRWKRSGLSDGDTVLIHSNIKRTLIEYRINKISISPQDILDSFIDVIGSKGTLLLPLFNFDFANGIPFDIRNSESQMGALTEVGRKFYGAVRTGHPIYSFAVIGYKSSEFEGIDNVSGYAEDSPFGVLKRLNGKIGSLDLEDQNSMTFYHHVEEIKRVDYRYFKSFSGDYTDSSGQTKNKKYDLYVRDIERGVMTNVNPAGELLWNAGLYSGFRPKEGPGLRLVNAKSMFHFVEKIIDSGKALGTLYSIEDSK
ncbi:AAC(3) family N-acetyltransferase [Novispirillum itersonii]|uniref:AAC(3) family N-acetyltransferase n=1 Tax=Novispirillum itersonii TaxID=189 RepID=UPI0009DC0B75|nr:AAC(3) family N-acetyltransferase [Novispirillum itersonii]